MTTTEEAAQSPPNGIKKVAQGDSQLSNKEVNGLFRMYDKMKNQRKADSLDIVGHRNELMPPAPPRANSDPALTKPSKSILKKTARSASPASIGLTAILNSSGGYPKKSGFADRWKRKKEELIPYRPIIEETSRLSFSIPELLQKKLNDEDEKAKKRSKIDVEADQREDTLANGVKSSHASKPSFPKKPGFSERWKSKKEQLIPYKPLVTAGPLLSFPIPAQLVNKLAEEGRTKTTAETETQPITETPITESLSLPIEPPPSETPSTSIMSPTSISLPPAHATVDDIRELQREKALLEEKLRNTQLHQSVREEELARLRAQSIGFDEALSMQKLFDSKMQLRIMELKREVQGLLYARDDVTRKLLRLEYQQQDTFLQQSILTLKDRLQREITDRISMESRLSDLLDKVEDQQRRDQSRYLGANTWTFTLIIFAIWIAFIVHNIFFNSFEERGPWARSRGDL